MRRAGVACRCAPTAGAGSRGGGSVTAFGLDAAALRAGASSPADQKRKSERQCRGRVNHSATWHPPSSIHWRNNESSVRSAEAGAKAMVRPQPGRRSTLAEISFRRSRNVRDDDAADMSLPEALLLTSPFRRAALVWATAALLTLAGCGADGDGGLGQSPGGSGGGGGSAGAGVGGSPASAGGARAAAAPARLARPRVAAPRRRVAAAPARRQAAAGKAEAGAGGTSVTPGEKFVGNITTWGAVRDGFSKYWNQISPENEGKCGEANSLRGWRGSRARIRRPQ